MYPHTVNVFAFKLNLTLHNLSKCDIIANNEMSADESSLSASLYEYCMVRWGWD